MSDGETWRGEVQEEDAGEGIMNDEVRGGD